MQIIYTLYFQGKKTAQPLRQDSLFIKKKIPVDKLEI